ESLGKITGMLTQAPVDFAALTKAVKTSLRDMDVVPNKLFSKGDGVPDLNPDRIYFEGTSLGGFTGAVFTGALPAKVEGVVYQVGGSSVINTLDESILWPGILVLPGIRDLVADNAGPGDAAALVSMAQHLVDLGDPINYAHRVRERNIPTLLLYADQDPIVTNPGSEAYMRVAELPIYGTMYHAVADLPGQTAARPTNGFAATQLYTKDIQWLPDPVSLTLHLTFARPYAIEEMRGYLDDRLRAND
ncbi:MAG: hypothetical protein R3A47_09490, partial [Polyangiales bacterium]